MNVSVTDSFEIKPGMPGITHAPGVVVVFDAPPKGGGLPSAGEVIRLKRKGVAEVDVMVGEVKTFQNTVTFYLEGLTRGDAPIGCVLAWPDQPGARKGSSRRAISGR